MSGNREYFILLYGAYGETISSHETVNLFEINGITNEFIKSLT